MLADGRIIITDTLSEKGHGKASGTNGYIMLSYSFIPILTISLENTLPYPHTRINENYLVKTFYYNIVF